jgi:hypothetical protein
LYPGRVMMLYLGRVLMLYFSFTSWSSSRFILTTLSGMSYIDILSIS